MSDLAEPLPHITDVAGMIAPERTALVVVDIQVDFAAAHDRARKDRIAGLMSRRQ